MTEEVKVLLGQKEIDDGKLVIAGKQIAYRSMWDTFTAVKDDSFDSARGKLIYTQIAAAKKELVESYIAQRELEKTP